MMYRWASTCKYNLSIVRLGRQARCCAQARRRWFSFRKIQRRHLFNGDLNFRTGLCFHSARLLGPGFYNRLGTRADLLSTQSTKVTLRTDRKTDDLIHILNKSPTKQSFNVTDRPGQTRQGGGLSLCETRWATTAVG